MNDRTEAEKKRLVEAQKLAIQQVIREWMDEQFAKFGRWTAAGIAALLFGLMIHMIVVVWGHKTINELIETSAHAISH